MMRIGYCIAAIIVILPITTGAQTILKGYLTDRETSKPVHGATVRIEGTHLGAITNSAGFFTISPAPSGKITVVATFVGFETARQSVFLRSNETTTMVFTIRSSAVSKGEVVVSANKRVQAVQDVPISLAVISSEDLAQRSITRLDEALRYVSGVSVAGDQVNIRGASGFAFGVGSRTAVLIDGFPILSGDNGDIKFDVLPVADVERIEVIKGAGSALYGTGALGGVVSLITKPATDSAQFYGRLYSGMYTAAPFESWSRSVSTPLQHGADLRYSKQIGDVSFSASGAVRTDDSYRDFDKSIRGFGYSKLAWQPTDYVAIRLFGFATVEDRENFVYWRDLKNATQPPLTQDLRERLATTKYAVGGEYSHILTETMSANLRYGFFRTTYENRIDGQKQDSNFSTAYAHNAEFQLTERLTRNIILTSGLNGRLNWVRSDVYGTALQHIISAYAQGEFEASTFVFTAGIRVDREETESLKPQLELSPKFGVSWKASNDLTIRSSIGRGFRAPTIAERYANIRYGPFTVRPNPQILSESSWSGEVGAHLVQSGSPLPFEVDAALFTNDLYDLIEPTFDLSSPGIPIVFTNVTRARILGLEATFRAIVSTGLSLETGLTLMQPTDLTTKSPLKYRNTVLWYSRGIITLTSWLEVQAEYRYQDRVSSIDDRLSLFVPDADARVPMHIVDARLFATVSDAMRIGLIGRNLLNYAFTEVVGNLGATRSIVLQLEVR